MAWGFKAINNAGAIQIDGEFSNMSMFRKGTVAFSDHSGDLGVYTIESFPARSGPPLIAVKTAKGSNFVGSCWMEGMVGEKYAQPSGERRVVEVRLGWTNQTAYRPITPRPPWVTTPVEMEYALFDEIGDILAPTDWGMQVCNDQEEVMFDSRRSYLEIVDSINFTVPPTYKYPGDDIGQGPDIGPMYLDHEYNPEAWYIINSLHGQVNVPQGGFFGIGAVWNLRLRQASNTKVELYWTQTFGGTESPPKTDTRQDGQLLMCREVFI